LPNIRREIAARQSQKATNFKVHTIFESFILESGLWNRVGAL